MDGYGRIKINNETDLPVVLKDVNTGGGIEGTITLIDKAKDNGLGLPLVTEYKRLGNQIQIYTNKNIKSYQVSSEANETLYGRDSSYSPQQDMRYFWMTGTATSDETETVYYHEYDKFLGFIPVGERQFSDSDIISSSTHKLSNDELPQGDFVYKESGIGDYTYKTNTIETSDKLVKQIDDSGTDWTWEKTSWWPHTPYPVKKTWIKRTVIRDTGTNTYHYYSVKADNPIKISFIGYDQGEVDVTSGGDIRIAGNINNNGGITNLTSTKGDIINDTLGSIKSKQLNLSAANGSIGAAGSSLRVTQTAGDEINANAQSDIYIKSVNGDLIINNLSTQIGPVSLSAEKNLQLIGDNPIIKGKNIYLEAKNGGIGTNSGIIDIDSDAAAGGVVNIISHEGDINVKEVSGDIRIGLIQAAGDVTLSVPDGGIINANPNQKVDTRTQAQLEALWKNMKLTGTDANTDNEIQLNAYKHSQEEAYQNYWRNYRNLTRNKDGSYSYSNYDPDVTFSYSDAQRNSLKQAGWTDEQIAASEQKITDDYRMWGKNSYNPEFTYTLTKTEKENLSEGYAWTDGELNGGLPSFLADQVNSNTIVQTQSPNIIAKNVTVTAEGGIGSDLSDVVYNYKIHTPVSPSTMDDVKLALASAERNDLVWNQDTGQLTIHRRKSVSVDASGTISMTANDRIFLESNQNANIYELVSKGNRIRLDVKGNIYSARTDGASNIQAKDSLILESENGAIGSKTKPINISLQGDAPYVTAKASGNIYLNKPEGNFYIDDIYSKNGDVALQSGGNVIDLLQDEQNDIYANNISITALGDIGQAGGDDKAIDIELAENGQLTLESTTGGANIFSGKAVQIGDSDTHGSFRLHAGGDIGVNGEVAAEGPIQLTTLGDILVSYTPATLSSTDSIDLSVGGEFVNQGTIKAGDWLRIETEKTGNIALDGLLSAKNDIYLSTNNTIFAKGTSLIAGDHLIISAANGVGSASSEIDTDVNAIDATTNSGGIYLNNDKGLTVGSIETNSGDIVVKSVTGDINLGEIKTENGKIDLETADGSIRNNNGDAINIWATADSKLVANGGIIGRSDNPLDVHIVGGKLSVLATKEYNSISTDINGTVNPSNTIYALNTSPGLMVFNNRMLGGDVAQKVYKATSIDSQISNALSGVNTYEEMSFTTTSDTASDTGLNDINEDSVNNQESIDNTISETDLNGESINNTTSETDLNENGVNNQEDVNAQDDEPTSKEK